MDLNSGAVPAAGVAIFNAHAQILLGTHHRDGRWATFGGRVEAGESSREAAVREVLEEVGVRLSGDLHELGVFGGSSLYTVSYPGWGPTSYEVTMYAAIVHRTLNIVRQTTEIAEVRWIDVSALDDVDLACDMQEIIPAACTWYSAQSPYAS